LLDFEEAGATATQSEPIQIAQTIRLNLIEPGAFKPPGPLSARAVFDKAKVEAAVLIVEPGFGALAQPTLLLARRLDAAIRGLSTSSMRASCEISRFFILQRVHP
jgi:hypothetical protein